VECGPLALRGNFEDRAYAVGPTLGRCAVQLPIGGLNQSCGGVRPVSAVRLGAEAIQRGQFALGSDFEDRAVAVYPALAICRSPSFNGRGGTSEARC